MQTKFDELMAMGPFSFVAIDRDRVNIDDLIECLEGRGGVVRCNGDPKDCITVFSEDVGAFSGCVAGWISEDEVE